MTVIGNTPGLQVQVLELQTSFMTVYRLHIFKTSMPVFLAKNTFMFFVENDDETKSVLNLWSNGLVVKALDSQSRGPRFKTTGWLQG